MIAEKARKEAEAKGAAERAAAEQKAKEQQTAKAGQVIEAQEGAMTLFDDPATAEHLAEEAAKAKDAAAKKPPM